MDQKFIAGIGNIYTDEILLRPGCATTARSETLSTQEIRRLYRAMVETLHEAIKHRGSTLADEQYVDLFGRPGDYQVAAQGLRPRGPGLPPLPHARSCAIKFQRPLHLLLPALPGLTAALRVGVPHGVAPAGVRDAGSSLASLPRPRMFLKTLTLKGFKSFAETTTLELEPGVTVVVGPNGSGKSNVVDAIGWVLGAQAPSAVRSQKMDDVIFAGTRQAPGARAGPR